MIFLSTVLIATNLLAANSSSITAPPSSPNTASPMPSIKTPQVNTPTITSPAVIPPKYPTAPSKIRSAESFPISSQSLDSIFTSPGVATLQNGRWVGSEHLYNLAQDFGVVVEIIQPTGQSIAINEASIRDKVLSLLSAAGLRPRTTLIANESPLPFLHILLMINPIERGYVVYFAARLFESVQVNRVHLKVDLTWQAITWEKQEILIFATEQLQTELFKTIDSVISSFTEKLKSYQNIQSSPGY